MVKIQMTMEFYLYKNIALHEFELRISSESPRVLERNANYHALLLIFHDFGGRITNVDQIKYLSFIVSRIEELRRDEIIKSCPR